MIHGEPMAMNTVIILRKKLLGLRKNKFDLEKSNSVLMRLALKFNLTNYNSLVT